MNTLKKIALIILIIFFSSECLVFAQSQCHMWISHEFNDEYFADDDIYRGDILLSWNGSYRNAFNDLTTALEYLKKYSCNPKTITIEGDTPIIIKDIHEMSDVNLILNGTIKLESEIIVELLSIRTEIGGTISGGKQIVCNFLDFNNNKIELIEPDLIVKKDIISYGIRGYLATTGKGKLILNYSKIFPVGTLDEYQPLRFEAPEDNIFAVQTEQEPLFPGGTNKGARWNIESVSGFNPEKPIEISFIYPKALLPIDYDNSLISIYFKYLSDDWIRLDNELATALWEDPNYLITKVMDVKRLGSFSLGYEEPIEKDITVFFYIIGAAIVLMVSFLVYLKYKKNLKKKKTSENDTDK